MAYALTSSAPSPTAVSQSNNADIAAFALRVTMGVLFVAHAAVKIFVFTPAGTVAFFEGLGLPGPLAYLVIGAELFGGLALFVGLWTRWVSLALFPILLGAIHAHLGAGFLFSNEGGGWEYPAFWAVALIVQALLGGGAFAVSRKQT